MGGSPLCYRRATGPSIDPLKKKQQKTENEHTPPTSARSWRVLSSGDGCCHRFHCRSIKMIPVVRSLDPTFTRGAALSRTYITKSKKKGSEKSFCLKKKKKKKS